MKWGLNVFLKYLTPSVALRDSRLSSPLHISASPTSRFFSAARRFVSSSTVNVQPIFDQLLVLKPGCWPIKKWWIFLLCFHFLLYIVMSTLRDMLQPMILLILFRILMRSHQNLPHSRSSLGLLKFSCNTHSRGTLFATRSSTFTTQQPRSATTLWLLVCSFGGNRT